MNELTILGDSIRDTLIRLRDKRAFLHQHQNYYLQVKNQLFGLNRKKNDSDAEEKIAETGLEFNDIIISTKGRVFVNIGYEYFVEKNKEEAIGFADEKLKLISEAVVQFTDKIREAESTESNIRELLEKGEDYEDDVEKEEEEDLPTMEIREELDHDDNVISSSIRPTKNHKSEKDNGLTDFEKNLKGKLISKKEEEKQATGSSPQIDIDNIYTFEDLVKEMDEQDQREDQLGEDEYLRSEQDEDEDEYLRSEQDEDEDEDEDGDSSMIPGSLARSAFLEQIRKLRRDRLPPPKSILQSESKKGKKAKTKKSVGFAETAAIHEVENLKDINKRAVHDPLQIDDDGTILTKTEFDGDLFAKLIGAQGPDEIHKNYIEELETREEREVEKIRSKKHVSKFKLEREGHAKRPVSDVAERGEPVSDIVEKIEPVSDIVERTEPVSDIVEKTEPASDIVESDASSTRDETSSIHPSLQTTIRNGIDIVGNSANNELHPRRGKQLKSLCKPKRKIKPQQRHLRLTEDRRDKKHSEPVNFPPEIQNAITPPQAVLTPKIDYRALGEDLDSMARAYTLGVYDDDLHEDPGVLVEKLEDFKNYNEQVGQLQDSIKEFQLNNSIQDQIDIDDQDAPLMTEIVENDLPANYDDQSDGEEDLSLHPDRLQESISLDYHRLKDSLMQNRFIQDLSEEDKQIEPIDEQGNPIKQSKFRTRRLRFRD